MAAAPDTKPPADGAQSRFPDTHFDALLVVSFGGPEGMDDVMPFLENVTRGRNVPRERLEEVAVHYARFGGVSPINAQNRALVAALRTELDARAIELPIYFGNRNWHPFLADTLRAMAEAGVERALAFLTSGFSSYSGCRQYRENIHDAQRAVGDGAPEVMRTRVFYNHPAWVKANAELLTPALSERPDAHVLFSAHSIPTAMAARCRYEAQLAESARLVADAAGVSKWQVVYQSRSGPPDVPWLEPDVCDAIEKLADTGVTDVVVAPLGFVSDHLEVLYDLDVAAREAAERAGVGFRRIPSVGTHPTFVAMIRELVQERLDPTVPRRAVGRFGPSHDVCPVDCCLPGTGRPSPWAAAASAA
jgi:ferrochelatase